MILAGSQSPVTFLAIIFQFWKGSIRKSTAREKHVVNFITNRNEKRFSLEVFKMKEKDGEGNIWGSPCTQFVVNRILVTFPQLVLGAKFEKMFRTEVNGYVFVIRRRTFE